MAKRIDDSLERIARLERIIQLWLRFNFGTLPGTPDVVLGPEFERKLLSNEEKAELMKLVYKDFRD